MLWVRRVCGTATRSAAVVALVAAISFGVPGALSDASAASETGTPGYCTGVTGVTVVVDFHELGGGVVVRCFPPATSSTTGLDALTGAGFSVTGVAGLGESFICRIEGKPTAAQEACLQTPPATAYWSYWYAPNGGTWKYSDLGLMSHRVILGGFEGWSFSYHKTASTVPPPGVAPEHPVVAPKPSPTPSTEPSTERTTSAPSSRATSTTSTATTGASTTGKAGLAPAPTHPASPSSGSTPGAVLAAGASPGPGVSFDLPSTATRSSPWSSVVGVVLAVGALGGAATVAVRRRRSRLADGG
jgi:LPXTG-motif cell wall-anchored protein